jgi:syntaxin 16
LLLSRASLYDSSESALERFFQLSGEIKQEIADLHSAYDTLLKKHKECLRPTFSDSADSMTEVSSLTASINARMHSLSQRINCINYPDPSLQDRAKILTNLRTALTESYNEFSTKYKIEQQAFSASFGKTPHMRRESRKRQEEVELSSLNFGPPANEQRQLQMRNQRNEEEIQQIARRAEEIRNIFVDLATMVRDQGTIIDRIDFCITESLANAVEAHSEVQKAARYQKKSRLWICVVVLVIVIAILFLMALAK